jgi:dUTP pyrophosphatase
VIADAATAVAVMTVADADNTSTVVPFQGHHDFVPTYASSGSAGADLRASLSHPITLSPGERSIIPTGISLELPDGYEGQVRPRSGLAVRHGLTVLNAPGTIDSDYRGEIKVPMINLGSQAFTIEPGMRIAQLVVAPCIRVHFRQQSSLEPSRRGEGGFGSTGVD